jgi:hypothetical protein
VKLNQYVSLTASVIIGLLFLAILYFAIGGNAPADIVSPYLAGWFFGHGQQELIYGFAPADMFAHAPPKAWLDIASQRGFAGEWLYPFLYPPVWAALMAPVSAGLTIPEFTHWVYILHLLSIWGSIFLAWKLAGKVLPFVVWSLVSFMLILGTAPALDALVENQPHIFIVMLMLFGLERVQANRSLFAGVLLGLAAAIKLFPFILILIFVFRRDMRGASTMLLTTFFFAALSFVLAGLELNLVFVENLRALSDLVFVYKNNWSFSTLAFQVYAFFSGHGAGSIELGYTAKLPVWIGMPSLVIWATGTGYWLWRAGQGGGAQRGLALSIALTWMAFFGPLGWPYYFLPLFYLLPQLLAYLSIRQGVVVMGSVIVVFHPIILVQLLGLSGRVNVAQLVAASGIVFLLIGQIILRHRLCHAHRLSEA